MTIIAKFFAKLRQRADLTLAVIGSSAFILFLLLRRLGIATPARISATLHEFMLLVGALFLLLLGAALVVKNSRENKPWSFIVIVMFAVLFRAALLGQTPWLSNDIYRYFWDAQLVDHGVNPYVLPPAAEELAPFRDTTIYPKMDHKTVHSVYPPVLQLLFWMGHKISQTFNWHFFVGLKLIFVLIDLGLVLGLWRLLAHLRLDPRWAVLYAWHPLPIIEIAGSGHTDGVGALTLVFALAFLIRRKYLLATIFLALGFLVKFLSVLLLPFLLVAVWQERGFKLAGMMAALFVALIAMSYAPFAAAGEKLISGLAVYSGKWRFNDGFFSLIFTGIHHLLPDGLVKYFMIPPDWEMNDVVMITRRIDLALIVAKIICGGVFAVIYLRWLRQMWISKNADERHWLIIFSTVLAAFFLLTPTLQPWYLIWLLPLLCCGELLGELKFYKSMIIALWLLSATVFLSYFVLEKYIQAGIWQEPARVKWVEYGIPFVFWLWRSERFLILKPRT